MINLIPNEEKKKMSKDFYLRLLTLSFTMLGVSLLVASVAILPSYFLSSAEKASFERKIAEENIHYLIEKTLLEEAEKKSIGPLIAKKAVISKLNAYFYKLSLTKKPSLSEMDSSIKVLITVMKRVVLSQFFNSGKDLESSFQVGDFNQSVLIPKNYSVQVVSFA